MSPRLRDRLKHPLSSIQYELQLMTPKGGWTNLYRPPGGDWDGGSFDSPPERPTFGEESGYPPGRYRCIKRVDGRIRGVLWTVESPDADDHYETVRKRERQRNELDQMSFEEIESAMDAGALDAVPDREIIAALLEEINTGEPRNDTKQDEKEEEQSDLSDLDQQLVEEVQQGSKLATGLLALEEWLESDDDQG